MSADRALLLALSVEARDARVRLDELAAHAAAWVASVPGDVRGAAVTEVQAFDSLGQRLNVLAGLLEGLGQGVAASDLVAAVPLSDMAARLAATEALADVAAGDLVLFE